MFDYLCRQLCRPAPGKDYEQDHEHGHNRHTVVYVTVAATRSISSSISSNLRTCCNHTFHATVAAFITKNLGIAKVDSSVRGLPLFLHHAR